MFERELDKDGIIGKTYSMFEDETYTGMIPTFDVMATLIEEDEFEAFWDLEATNQRDKELIKGSNKNRLPYNVIVIGIKEQD